MNAPLEPFLKAQVSEAADVRKMGVLIGTLLALDGDNGEPLVQFPGQEGSAAVRARSVVDLGGADIGRAAVLMFEEGDPARPVLLGLLQDGRIRMPRDRPRALQVEGDGQRLTIGALDRLVLRCGRASITLTHAGTVLIEGSYVVSRATGTNRVQGGSVQVN